MPFEIVMPRLGWDMQTGRLGEWLKQDGEYVNAGEALFTVEGDKATQEVEALDSGILYIPPDSPPPGKEVPVGTLLGYLLQPGEVAPPTAAKMDATAQAPAPPPTAHSSSISPHPLGTQHASQPPTTRRKPPAISPRARRIAEELGVDWTQLEGSGRTGRIVERDVRQAAAAQARKEPDRMRVSPLARRLAEDLGVDLAELAAKLPGKRIERADVEAASRKASPAGTLLPISPVRRIIAERMATSAHTTASVTLTTEADATELVRLRRQLKKARTERRASDEAEPVPSYNDLLVKLVATALTEHPTVNARFEGDGIVQAATVNIGIAVDTDRGLLVPVLRDVQKKSLRQIARESAALIEKARSGHIGVDELQGGTFTITNLGMYEIDAFTPIINLPECAILGIGRIVPKQVVMDIEAERVAIRHMMFLSLSFDHRLVDGAPAARFLQRVKQYVERPYLWLVG